MEDKENNNIMLENMEYIHHIIKYLENEDILNMMCLNKLFFHNLRRSKILLKNFKREYHREIEDALFMKGNFFLLINSELIFDILKNTDEIFFNRKYKIKVLISVWIGIFVFLVLNVFPLFYYMKENNFISNSLWLFMIPMNLSWVISIVVYFTYKNYKRLLKNEIFECLESHFKNMKYRDHTHKKYLLDMIILRNKNHSDQFFEKLIQIVILFYSPLLIKMMIDINNEFILTIAALLVFVWEYISSFLYFLKFNIDKKSDTFSKYKEISHIKQKLIPKINQILGMIEFEKIKKKCSESEFALNSIYFFFKLMIYVLFIFYFKVIGAKLDRTSKISWNVLFIPIYLAEIPIIIFCILHFFSLRNKKCSIITKALTLLFIFSGYFINSILIPLKAEGYEINSIYIPILFLFSSINFYFHYKYVS